jgi:hypothetical protein
MGRKIKVVVSSYNLYSNLYVFLIGDPAVGKGTAMNIALNMLYQVPTVDVSADSITAQAITKTLSGTTEKGGVKRIITLDGREIETSSLIAGVREAGVLIKKDDPVMHHLLCELFDCPDRWEYGTVGRGKEPLRNVWFGLLAGSTPRWISETVTVDAMEEGFASRVLFCYTNEIRHGALINPFSQLESLTFVDLIADLNRISAMSGVMTFDRPAVDILEDWNNKNYLMVKENKVKYIFKGYYGRKSTHLIKLSMILKASRGDSLIIKEEDVIGAISYLELLEPGMFSLFSSSGKSSFFQDCMLIISVLKEVKKISKPKLMERVLDKIENADKFDAILDSLSHQGRIESKLEFSEWIYAYKE